ncbi:hypothetical protein Zmor_026291 [Zophobas morio]|uniref:Uncharacterized protein n=1 Tax=Zophobas morio TaxID=2755281 RepID=A0AA38HU16_9CUCU|nr:hypothetical protein Zmor_026291 [Zophobas morio]
MTSTFSTIVNFSIKDMLHRSDRLQTINNIKNDLDKKFIFPREIRKKSSIMKRDFVKNDDLGNISDKDIQSTVESALRDCLGDTEDLGMKVIDFSYVFLPPVKTMYAMTKLKMKCLVKNSAITLKITTIFK